SGGPCNTDADCPGTVAGSCAGSNKCHGGPNGGMACTPADSVVGTLGDFPTTHDCPPPTTLDIGNLPIAFALSTGTMTKTGQTLTGPVTAQARVYCGFCRAADGAGTNCFEGDPNKPPTPGRPPHNFGHPAGNHFNFCP